MLILSNCVKILPFFRKFGLGTSFSMLFILIVEFDGNISDLYDNFAIRNLLLLYPFLKSSFHLCNCDKGHTGESLHRKSI